MNWNITEKRWFKVTRNLFTITVLSLAVIGVLPLLRHLDWTGVNFLLSFCVIASWLAFYTGFIIGTILATKDLLMSKDEDDKILQMPEMQEQDKD